MHIGDYGSLGAEYDRLERWIAENGHVAATGPWEVYYVAEGEGGGGRSLSRTAAE